MTLVLSSLHSGPQQRAFLSVPDGHEAQTPAEGSLLWVKFTPMSLRDSTSSLSSTPLCSFLSSASARFFLIHFIDCPSSPPTYSSSHFFFNHLHFLSVHSHSEVNQQSSWCSGSLHLQLSSGRIDRAGIILLFWTFLTISTPLTSLCLSFSGLNE